MAATLTRRSGTYDALTDTTTGAATTDYAVYVTPPQPIATREVDGTAILRTDLVVFIAAKDLDEGALAIIVAPSIKTDVLTVQSHPYRIVQSKPYSGGSQVAVYELTIRR